MYVFRKLENESIILNANRIMTRRQYNLFIFLLLIRLFFRRKHASNNSTTRKIAQYLDELIIKEHKAGKKTSEIANMIGRSKETVGKRITQLISQGKLESKRHPKASAAEASNTDNVDEPIQVGDNNGQIKL